MERANESTPAYPGRVRGDNRTIEEISMTDKQAIIDEMLQMQRKFIEIEQQGEFSAEEYYDSEGETELSKYKQRYDDLARQLVDMAHEEKGSKR